MPYLLIMWHLYLPVKHLVAVGHKQGLKIHSQARGGMEGVLTHSNPLLFNSVIVSAVTMKRVCVHKENT